MAEIINVFLGRLVIGLIPAHQSLHRTKATKIKHCHLISNFNITNLIIPIETLIKAANLFPTSSWQTHV